MDKSIIYLMTEFDRTEATKKLREMGLSEVEPNRLHFVDAYTETAGIYVCDQPNTVYADCNSLSSIDIAISKVANRLGKEGGLLIFDSLTSPYLFNGSEILRFMRQTLEISCARKRCLGVRR